MVEVVGSREVDVSHHLLSVGTVCAIGLALREVGFAKAHRGKVVGVVPITVSHNHFPPHTIILSGVNPRSVFNFARLIEVVDEIRREHGARIIAHHHGAPRRFARRLHIAHIAHGIGSESGFEHHILIIEIEVHGGIIHTGSLVDIDVEPVVALQLE